MSPVAPALCRSQAFRHSWEALVSATSNLYAQEQSPEWHDYLEATRFEELLPPVAVHDAAGTLLGLAPIVRREYDLEFNVHGCILGRFRLRTLCVLGSVPLLPDDPGLYDRVLVALDEAHPECDAIHLGSVPTDSFCWKHLQSSQRLQGRFRMFAPWGACPFHSLELPATYERYVAALPGAKRYKLRQKVRRLREHGGGELRIERVDTASEVSKFLEASTAVASRAWQGPRGNPKLYKFLAQPDSLVELARRGLLRSYTLSCAAVPCAIVLGTQYRDIYHYVEIGYDPRFAEFSPGTVLLHLLIEDLLHHRPARRINFGSGDLAWKREFGNVHAESASVLLLRRTPANAVRYVSYSAYRSIVRFAKDRLRAAPAIGRGTPPPAIDEIRRIRGIG
ncbi:MAG: GNAT family N-acetyltransferase [Isosphaeraceae bacterium]|nr:GNAT family N-acetyltransferase [Isosphaeraceae bacterium]